MINLDKILKTLFQEGYSLFLLMSFLVILFVYNLIESQVNMFYEPRHESKKLQINKYSYVIIIILSILLAINIAINWASNKIIFNIYENYLILFLCFFLFSGIFGLLIFFLFSASENHFSFKSDVLEILAARVHQRYAESAKIAESRIRNILFEESKLIDQDVIKILARLPHDKNEFQELDKLFPDSTNFTRLTLVSMNIYWVLQLPSKNLLVFNHSLDGGMNTANELYQIFLVKDEKFLLFSSKESPVIANYVDYFNKIKFNNIKQVKSEIIINLFSKIKLFEEGISCKISAESKEIDLISIGFIWHYVVLFLAGSKIDYFIAVSSKAKSIIIIMAFFRLIVLGTFLSIIVNK